jgi:hypothetical protein
MGKRFRALRGRGQTTGISIYRGGMRVSIWAFAIVNFVLAAGVVAAIVRLHVWAILTAHRDHVPAFEPAPEIVVADQWAKAPPAEVAVSL